MAKVLIINDDYGQLARSYYLRFPEEPILKAILPVEKPVLVERMSIATLLTAILAAFKDKQVGTDLVIVSHGNENGMVMGLFPGHPKNARTDNLLTLMGGETRDKKAELLSLRPELIDELITKMEAVRKIGLGHVAFRGCTIGTKSRNLSVLKDFLGAGVVSGTNLYSTFGPGLAHYVTSKKKFDALVERYEKTGHIYESSARVILATSPAKEAYTEIIIFYLESEDVLLDWLQTHLVSSTTKDTAVAVKSNVPLHYLSGKPPVLPLDGVSKKGGVRVGYADFIRDTDNP
jgi:hypothetical protein